MIYEFLKDFHRRCEIIAIVDFLTARISKKLKFRDYELNANESVNLILLVLCFIMEKSLIDEICTKNDVANFIRRIDTAYIKKNISDDEYINLADFLLKDCLQNSGVPYYFTAYNFESEKEDKINIKLIDDKRVSVGIDNVYAYYMTPQGYKFMFSTLEIEDSMQVSIEQFKLSLSIKKKNFNAARNNVDNLFNISRTQIQKINYFIKRVKEDIASAGIEEYESIYSGTFSSIEEQKEGYENLYELIVKAENMFIEAGSAALNSEMNDLAYIKNKLKSIIGEQSNLLIKQQELQKIYNEAVDNILYIGFDNRFDFEEKVIKKLEDDPALSYPLIKILRPLFKIDINKLLNLNIAVKEQKIILAETIKENNILMSDRFFNRIESDNDTKIKEINEKYINIFEIICRYALDAPGREISLSKIVDTLGNNYKLFVPDLKILTNVLLQLTVVKDVDFISIKNQQSKTVFNPSESFDIKYCVIRLLNKNKRYSAIKSIQVLLSRNKYIFVPEKLSEDLEKSEDSFLYENITGLNCPDILFKAEVNNE